MKTVQIGGKLSAFWAQQDGVTAIEYALLGALIAVVIAGSIGLVGDAVLALYQDVAQKVVDATF